MTVTTAAPPPAGGDPGDGRRASWMPTAPGSGWPGCGASHQAGAGGSVDEQARRLSHEEFRVARLLAADGHRVRSLPESRTGGRRPDLEVCGSGVEVKSFLPLAERGRPPTPQSVFNKLMNAAGQADSVFLYGAGSGLTPRTVRAGLARLAADGRAPRLSAVRAVGDGFDLAWARGPGIARRLSSQLQRRPPGPQLGL